MSAETQPTTMHIDYREAFVVDMEMAAHGPTCKPCMLAALKGEQENYCDRMKYMRAYVKKAYEALPPYYKQRYETASNTALRQLSESIKDLTGGR